MDAHALGAFIVPEDSKPARQISNMQYNVHPIEPCPNVIELDAMPIGISSPYTGPQKPPPVAKNSRSEVAEFSSVGPDGQIESSTRTPNELEMSGPPTPSVEDATTIVESWNNPPITKWRVLTTCLVYFCNGCNDSGELRGELSALEYPSRRKLRCRFVR